VDEIKGKRLGKLKNNRKYLIEEFWDGYKIIKTRSNAPSLYAIRLSSYLLGNPPASRSSKVCLLSSHKTLLTQLIYHQP